MTKANLDIRQEAKNAGVALWRIAAALSISEQTFVKRLRFELSEKDKKKIRDIIVELKEGE